MDGKTQSCLRILGLLLLVLIFTLQAQAVFQTKTVVDLSPAIETAKQDLRETILNYENEFSQRLAREDAEVDQNMIPNWNLIAANRGK